MAVFFLRCCRLCPTGGKWGQPPLAITSSSSRCNQGLPPFPSRCAKPHHRKEGTTIRSCNSPVWPWKFGNLFRQSLLRHNYAGAADGAIFEHRFGEVVVVLANVF